MARPVRRVSPIFMCVRYLATMVLGGNVRGYRALLEYFINDESPSVLRERYGLESKHVLRGYAQRVMEYIGPSRPRIALLLRRFEEARRLLGIEPVVRPLGNDGACTCEWCGSEVPCIHGVYHVANRHGRERNEVARRILEAMGL